MAIQDDIENEMGFYCGAQDDLEDAKTRLFEAQNYAKEYEDDIKKAKDQVKEREETLLYSAERLSNLLLKFAGRKKVAKTTTKKGAK